jgi:hypothetical protein
VVLRARETPPHRATSGLFPGPRSTVTCKPRRGPAGSVVPRPTGVSFRSREEPGGCPPIGQAVSGMEATRARSAASA